MYLLELSMPMVQRQLHTLKRLDMARLKNGSVGIFLYIILKVRSGSLKGPWAWKLNQTSSSSPSSPFHFCLSPPFLFTLLLCFLFLFLLLILLFSFPSFLPIHILFISIYVSLRINDICIILWALYYYFWPLGWFILHIPQVSLPILMNKWIVLYIQIIHSTLWER